MNKPLTKDERRLWKLGTEDIATNARGFVGAEVLAMNRQRYEATLAEKDRQIERLTRGLREITEMTVCDALGEPFRRAQLVAWDAIQEAGQ